MRYSPPLSLAPPSLVSLRFHIRRPHSSLSGLLSTLAPLLLYDFACGRGHKVEFRVWHYLRCFSSSPRPRNLPLK